MTDTMREKFERFIFDSNLEDDCQKSPRTYEYENMERDWLIWQAAQADARTEMEKARALVGGYLDFMKKYRVCLIAEHGDLDEKAKAVSVLDEKITKAQAFMEGK